jgi:hypothetical protein
MDEEIRSVKRDFILFTPRLKYRIEKAQRFDDLDFRRLGWSDHPTGHEIIGDSLMRPYYDIECAQDESQYSKMTVRQFRRFAEKEITKIINDLNDIFPNTCRPILLDGCRTYTKGDREFLKVSFHIIVVGCCYKNAKHIPLPDHDWIDKAVYSSYGVKRKFRMPYTMKDDAKTGLLRVRSIRDNNRLGMIYSHADYYNKIISDQKYFKLLFVKPLFDWERSLIMDKNWEPPIIEIPVEKKDISEPSPEDSKEVSEVLENFLIDGYQTLEYRDWLRVCYYVISKLGKGALKPLVDFTLAYKGQTHSRDRITMDIKSLIEGFKGSRVKYGTMKFLIAEYGRKAKPEKITAKYEAKKNLIKKPIIRRRR